MNRFRALLMWIGSRLPAGRPLPKPSHPRDLTAKELRRIHLRAACPYCNGGLYDGPQGGLSTNVLCGDPDGCHARFNIGPVNIPIGQYTGDDHVAARQINGLS